MLSQTDFGPVKPDARRQAADISAIKYAMTASCGHTYPGTSQPKARTSTLQNTVMNFVFS
jgi:hypothetical protein